MGLYRLDIAREHVIRTSLLEKRVPPRKLPRAHATQHTHKENDSERTMHTCLFSMPLHKHTPSTDVQTKCERTSLKLIHDSMVALQDFPWKHITVYSITRTQTSSYAFGTQRPGMNFLCMAF